MSTTVKYNGTIITSVENETKVLKTAKKYMLEDVILSDSSPGGSAITVADETLASGGIARYINAVNLSEDTVTPESLLTGVVAHNRLGEKIIGTHAENIFVQSKEVSPSNETQIITPDGGYNGLSSVTINAIPSDYVGEGIEKLAETIYTPSTNNQIISKDTYNEGDQIILGDEELIPENIKQGVDLFGVQGSYFGETSWTLLGSHTYEVSTDSTSASTVGSFTVCKSWDASKIIYIKVRDVEGPKKGCFLGSDSFFMNCFAANDYQTPFATAARIIHFVTDDEKYEQYTASTTNGYGVYGYSISPGGSITIRKRYSDEYSLTINGTYLVEVYSLDFPNNESPFNFKES